MDDYWCLGDIVGYGPDPRSCLAIIREKCCHIIAGNHDLAAAGEMDISSFNSEAAQACLWTSNQLDESELSYLRSLDLKIVNQDFTLVHGSPREPVWEYLISRQQALENFLTFETPFCLVGHSHIPIIFEEGKKEVETEYPFPLIKKISHRRLIINPGSVGQPRDGDWRASYIIYDSSDNTIELRRLEYNIMATQDKMRKAGLPSYLIARLSVGQ